MGAFNLSSNPLSTLFPNLSPQQDPNYGNAFQIDLGNLKSTTSPMPDYAKQFAEETQPMLNQMKFKVGLMTSGSSNPAIAFKGKQMTDEVVSDMFSSIFPTDGSQTPNKPSFFSKIGGWQTVGAAADMLGSFMPEKDEYSGTKGDLTQTLDSTYDNIANTLMAIPGWGTLAGGIMKAGSFLGKGVNALGGGTDGMTTTDAILGSSFLNLTPFGLINGFGGSKTNTITKDEQVFETVGSSYTGTNQTVNDALTKSGKKYGLFSSKARDRANEEIEEAKRQQGVMSWVADEATDRFAIRDSMAAINGNRRKYYLQGGYNQADVRVGKSGMSLDLIAKAKKVLHESRKLKGGGQITPTEILLVVPEFQDGGQINKKSRTLQELIEYAKKKNPRFIQRMSEPLKYVEWIDKDGKTTHGTHELTYSEDDNGYFIFPMIQEDNKGNLVRYTNWREAYDNAFKNKNGLYVDTKDEAELFTVSGQNDDDTFYGYKAGWPEFFNQKPEKYQLGGSISQKVRDYYKDYNLNGVTVINDNSPRTEGTIIYSPSDEFTVHELWHYLSQNRPNESLKEFYDSLDDSKLKQFGADLNFVKRTGDPSDFYNPSELEARLKAAKFMSQGQNYTKEFFRNLRNNETQYGDNMRDLLRMFNDDYLERLFNLDSAQKFQEGGSINVIPEGALHAHKHNMDMEGITPKGIPVVSNKEGGEVEQQAEIEREEIIFRLEVTKKLEELEEKYYDEETSQREKDECALEAGKLLVEEILYNTQDNTNSLL